MQFMQIVSSITILSPSARRAMLRLLNVVFIVATLAGCASSKFVVVKSENFDERIRYIVIHYTSENFEDSLRLLTKKSVYPVSSHYLIPQKGDPTYPGHRLRTHILVDERDRAWHAGRSRWSDQINLNHTSIGIELVNMSGCEKPIQGLGNSEEFYDSCHFREFDDEQISLLVELLTSIHQRYPDLKPINIVGHSDIATDRKVDPGPTFPWKRLYKQGFGIWYDEDDYRFFRRTLKENTPTVEDMQSKLRNLGYSIEVSGQENLASQLPVRAFQMRFLGEKFSGFFDLETAAILYALHRKYIEK